MRLTPYFSIISALVAGCASNGPHTTAQRSEAPQMEIARTTDIPNAHEPAEHSNVQEDSVPVWKQTKVVKVKVAGYINAKGEAFPETYKYVILEPGSWNIAALNHPERAYIPNENIQEVSSAPGVISGQISPGSAITATRHEQATQVLFDMSQIRITGYYDPSDEAKVRALAESLKNEMGDCAVALDPNLGYIIVPATAVRASPGSVTEARAKMASAKNIASESDKDIH